jgi:hypothetical protein
MMAEPDVTLTDYGLAVLSAGLACGLPSAAGPAATAWRMFFGSVAVAAAAGGTVHGFFPHPGGAVGSLLWMLAQLAVGATALAAWCIGAAALPARAERALRVTAACALAVYAAVVVAVRDDFGVAVAFYLPAAVFLLGALARQGWRGRPGAPLAVLGLAVLLGGSWVQGQRIRLPALNLTHNALYHVIEAVALLLMFLGARRLLVPTGATRAGAPHGR